MLLRYHGAPWSCGSICCFVCCSAVLLASDNQTSLCSLPLTEIAAHVLITTFPQSSSTAVWRPCALKFYVFILNWLVLSSVAVLD